MTKENERVGAILETREDVERLFKQYATNDTVIFAIK
jgi:hypothetical protein